MPHMYSCIIVLYASNNMSKIICFAMSMQVVYILAISLFRHLLQLLTVGLHNRLDNCVQEFQHINGVVDFSKCGII